MFYILSLNNLRGPSKTRELPSVIQNKNRVEEESDGDLGQNTGFGYQNTGLKYKAVMTTI